MPDLVDVDRRGGLAVELRKMVVYFEPVPGGSSSGVAFNGFVESFVVDIELTFGDGGHNKSRRIVMRQDTNATTMVRVSSSTYSTLYVE